MKVLFMGTPAFAAISLKRLLQTDHAIVGVVTRPDARSGRGLRSRTSPVKDLAVRNALTVFQPVKINAPEFIEEARALAPDVIVVVAFGCILGSRLLTLPRHGAINLHASLLPRYRGAAPIPWAIDRGESETGVTTQRMTRELDAGDILLQRATRIGEEETAGSLGERLAVMGADLLVETLAGVASGAIRPRPQDDSEATLAPRLSKSDGRIAWDQSAERIGRRIRAFDPWPGAYTVRAAKPGRLLIWKASPASGPLPPAAPGTVLAAVGPGGHAAQPGSRPGVLVACGDSTGLILEEVQPAGGRRMSALAALAGRHLVIGDRLGVA
ncbi:MAG: methionyl-tRNA formyltransferase [Acidobacteriota bacterium]